MLIYLRQYTARNLRRQGQKDFVCDTSKKKSKPLAPSCVHHVIPSYSSADNDSADDGMLMRLIFPTS